MLITPGNLKEIGNLQANHDLPQTDQFVPLTGGILFRGDDYRFGRT